MLLPPNNEALKLRLLRVGDWLNNALKSGIELIMLQPTFAAFCLPLVADSYPIRSRRDLKRLVGGTSE